MNRILIAAVLAVALTGCGVRGATDDSDPANGTSGMSVYRDNLTGCEYLGVGYSLTPRMNRDGTQVCR